MTITPNDQSNYKMLVRSVSEYLCTQIFLPLGLPATDDFWSKHAVPWTAVKIWSGQNVPADHAVE